MWEEEAGHDCQRGDEQSQGISRTLVDPIRDQLGGDEEDPDHHQHDQEHDRYAVLHIQLVLNKVGNQGGEHSEAKTAQDEGDHQLDEGLVPEGDQDGFERRQFGRCTCKLGSFMDGEGGDQRGDDGNNAKDRAGGAPGLLHIHAGTLEDPCQDGGEGRAQDVAEDAEHHADGGKAGALVVVTGQLGGEGVVGGGGHGVEGIHQPEAEQDGEEGSRAGKSFWKGEHDPGSDAQRHGADDHVNAPAPEAGAGAVGPVTEERVVEGVPGELAHHQSHTGKGRVDARHVGVVEEQEELHGGGDQGKAQVSQTVTEFAAKRQFLVHVLPRGKGDVEKAGYMHDLIIICQLVRMSNTWTGCPFRIMSSPNLFKDLGRMGKFRCYYGKQGISQGFN